MNGAGDADLKNGGRCRFRGRTCSSFIIVGNIFSCIFLA
jgi:hypothetical protein